MSHSPGHRHSASEARAVLQPWLASSLASQKGTLPYSNTFASRKARRLLAQSTTACLYGWPGGEAERSAPGKTRTRPVRLCRQALLARPRRGITAPRARPGVPREDEVGIRQGSKAACPQWAGAGPGAGWGERRQVLSSQLPPSFPAYFAQIRASRRDYRRRRRGDWERSAPGIGRGVVIGARVLLVAVRRSNRAARATHSAGSAH